MEYHYGVCVQESTWVKDRYNSIVILSGDSNDNELAIAKLAISGFVSPENLSPYNTTLFEANGEVGNEYYVDTQGLIVPEAVESSTVNLEEEFARMITVQRAYSLNAQSLTVNDEMLSLLVDLYSHFQH